MKYLALLITLLVSSSSCVALVSDFSTNSLASQKLSKKVANDVRKLLPEAAEILESRNINKAADEKKYLAVSYKTMEDIQRERREIDNDQDAVIRVAVFEIATSHITIIDKSRALVSYGPRDHIRFATNDNTLIITHRNVGSYVSEQNETWKFAFIDNKLILVGYDDIYSGIDDEKIEQYHETTTSINFLAGKVVHWRKVGYDIAAWNERKKWFKPFSITKSTKYRGYAYEFRNKQKIHFGDFDIDKFRKWRKSEKYLCGFVDDNFKYSECRKDDP